MKKFLSLVLALIMAMSLVTMNAGAKDFTDASKIDYTEAVDVISALKVIDGYADGSFAPNGTLTRGAAAKIICNMILGPTTAAALNADAAPFVDVPANHTFAGYIAYCVQQGIISGYADGTFRPAGTVTGYQFMKMLLGALGYDSATEGFTGANWSVNVAKLAISLGLDDGNDEFVGTAAMTREEACLYAFNTLTSDMVEYGSKTTVVVGGTEVTVGGSKATKVEDPANKNKYDGENDYVLQFCEKYFPKLKLDSAETEDAFCRPSNVWTYKSDEVGTYAKTPDAVFTAKVEAQDVYKALGLTKTTYFAVAEDGAWLGEEVDVDGGEEGETEFVYDLFKVVKGDDEVKFGGGNGVLIEFYKDEAVAIIINTYVGEIVTVEEETSKQDAYVVVSAFTDVCGEAEYNDEFETEGFEEDDIVLFTYSLKEDEIQSVSLAKLVTGEVDEFVVDSKTKDKSVKIDGKSYKFSNMFNDKTEFAVETELDAYLDAYGYVIYVDAHEGAVLDMALVLKGAKDSSSRGDETDYVKLMYTDGTTDTPDAKADYSGKVGQWVNYSTSSKGKVTLTDAKGIIVENISLRNPESYKTATFAFSNGKATIVTDQDGEETLRANANTVFIVEDRSADTVKIYTGIKNMPGVDAKAGSMVEYSVFTKDGSAYASLVYVSVASAASLKTDGKTYLFVAAKNADLTTNKDYKYYSYTAIVDGEIKTIKVSDDVHKDLKKKVADGGVNLLTKSYSIDSNGCYVLDKFTAVDGDNGENAVDNVVKASGGVIVLGDESLPLADDVAVFKADGGKITKSTISALRTGNTAAEAAAVTHTVTEEEAADEEGDYFGYEEGEVVELEPAVAAGYYAQISYLLNSDGEVTVIVFELK